MKGKQLLYNQIVSNSLPLIEGERGQRNVYVEKHRDKIASRYYYHATICRLRYDDCLLALSEEFSLTTNTIIVNLKKRLAFINRLVQNETTTAELRRRYPYFDWSARIMVPTLPL